MFAALSFVIMMPAAHSTATGKASPVWLVLLFLIQTIGEMCLSPVGLSTMTKLAPPHLTGLVMGIWFLASALGSKLAGALASEFTATDTEALVVFFGNQAVGPAVAALLLFAISPWVQTLMGGVH